MESPTGAPEVASVKRTPAVSPATKERLLKFVHSRRARKVSLTEIKQIEDSLRSIESTFIFPSQLDFTSRPPSPTSDAASESGSSLAYTTNNQTVHAYEHALNSLLEKLDSIESGGDLEVRGRRKEVVNEVEKALKDVERKVEESRERASIALAVPLTNAVEKVIEVEVQVATISDGPESQVENAGNLTNVTHTESNTDFSLPTENSGLTIDERANPQTVQEQIPTTTIALNDVVVEDKLAHVSSNQPTSLPEYNSAEEASEEGTIPNAHLDQAETTPATLDVLHPVLETPSSPSTSTTEILKETASLVSPTPASQTFSQTSVDEDIQDPVPAESQTETSIFSSPSLTPFLLQSSPIADPKPPRANITTNEVAFDQDAEIIDAESKAELDKPQPGSPGNDAHRSQIEHDADDWSEVEA